MLLIIELQCSGFAHEEFNAAFLYGYSLAYPEEKVFFFAEKSHINSVKDVLLSAQLSIKQLHFKEIIIPETQSLSNPSVIFQYLKILKTVLDFSLRNNCTKIAFLSIYTYNLIPLKYLLNFNYKNSFKVHIVMHGTLEFIKRKNFTFFSYNLKRLIYYIKRILNIKTKLLSSSSMNRFLYEKLFKFTLKLIGNRNITYFVMREDSLARINNYLPKEFKYFKAIDLPYIYNKIEQNREINDLDQLTFATFGKGSTNELRQVADYFARGNYNKTNCKLMIIGGDLMDEFDKYDQIDYPIKNRRFTRLELEDILLRVDYFIFLYEEESYELTTSGAFFDAIAYLKPMVFLNNHCFDHYYEQYKFGYKCQNINGMLLTLDTVIENHDQNYKGLLKEIKRMQNDTSITHNYSKLYFDN